MRKRLPAILTVFFVVVFILQITALLFLLINPAAAIEFTPQVEIPGGPTGTVQGDTIAKYIKAIYQYGIAVVGILAAIVLMFGGLLWLTAGGNTGQVSEAKEWIKSSLLGLILALLSYTILLTINPDLVNFRPITVTPINKTTGSNPRNNGSVDYMDVPPIYGDVVLPCTNNNECNGGYCEHNTSMKDKLCQFGELGDLCTDNRFCKSGLSCQPVDGGLSICK